MFFNITKLFSIRTLKYDDFKKKSIIFQKIIVVVRSKVRIRNLK